MNQSVELLKAFFEITIAELQIQPLDKRGFIVDNLVKAIYLSDSDDYRELCFVALTGLGESIHDNILDFDIVNGLYNRGWQALSQTVRDDWSFKHFCNEMDKWLDNYHNNAELIRRENEALLGKDDGDSAYDNWKDEGGR